FGLGGAAAADKISVRWTDGSVENFGWFQANQTIFLKEGTAKPVEPPDVQEETAAEFPEETPHEPQPEAPGDSFDGQEEIWALDVSETAGDLQLPDIIDKKSNGGCGFSVYNMDKFSLPLMVVMLWILANLSKGDVLSGNSFQSRSKKKKCS
ncbi:MAG: ASPIC/UnbV domain-containing protein, partial [Deltaproteobacteria bacterium]|nr:ASPIC/UnbV domain-containing protein [Deltaproteobacteria bacterium]